MRLKLSGPALIAGIVAVLVCALLVMAVYQLWRQHTLDGARSETLSRLATLRVRMESELNSVIHVTDGLVSYIMVNPAMGDDEFRRIASMLMDRKPGMITHFTAAPDNVIRFLYPVEGNEAALGLDLSAHPDQSDSVRHMMATRNTVLAGPWELVQGGVRLIVRSPIFVEDLDSARRYWGLVSIPVDMQRLYEAIDLADFERTLEVAIRGRDGLGSRGGTFHGDPALFRTDALLQEVTLLGGSWEIAARPIGGWKSALRGLGWWWSLGTLFSLGGGVLAGHLARQAHRIRMSETKYRNLMDKLSDGACIIQEGWLRFVNPRLCEITGHDADTLLSRGLLDFVMPDDREQLLALKSRCMTGEGGARPLEAELRIARADGVSRYVRMNLSRVDWGDRPALLATVSDIDDRKRLSEALRESHERLNGIVRALPDIAFVISANGRYLDLFGGWNSRYYRQGKALIGKSLAEAHGPERAAWFQEVISMAIESGRLQTIEYMLEPGPAGSPSPAPAWFEGRVMPMGGDILGQTTVIWLALNITARKQLEETLRLDARVFEASNEGIFITDGENRIVSVNGAFTRITGYEPAEVMGRSPRVLSSGRHDRRFYELMWDEITHQGRWEGEIWNRRKDGRVYPQNLSVSVVRDTDGRITHHIAIFSDITRRKEAEEQIRHMALHDNLTGLANRTLLKDRLDQGIEQSRRDGTLLALLFIDLDDFKPVNDRLGHDAGDRVLQEVSMRLRAAVRRVDTVARLGGDEFVVLVQGIDEQMLATRVAEKIIRSVEQPIAVNGDHCLVGASVGISLFPLHGDNHGTLMQAADQALYRAKALGKHRHHVWEPPEA